MKLKKSLLRIMNIDLRHVSVLKHLWDEWTCYQALQSWRCTSLCRNGKIRVHTWNKPPSIHWNNALESNAKMQWDFGVVTLSHFFCNSIFCRNWSQFGKMIQPIYHVMPFSGVQLIWSQLTGRWWNQFSFNVM